MTRRTFRIIETIHLALLAVFLLWMMLEVPEELRRSDPGVKTTVALGLFGIFWTGIALVTLFGVARTMWLEAILTDGSIRMSHWRSGREITVPSEAVRLHLGPIGIFPPVPRTLRHFEFLVRVLQPDERARTCILIAGTEADAGAFTQEMASHGA